MPAQVETWLIEPLKAPEFSLPDLAGKLHELASLRGSSVLLIFWATTSPLSLEQLWAFEQQPTARGGLRILAINLDDENSAGAARARATQSRFSFPVVFATEELAGIYNIIYRYLFDRRRDLPIPVSFLLDGEG